VGLGVHVRLFCDDVGERCCVRPRLCIVCRWRIVGDVFGETDAGESLS